MWSCVGRVQTLGSKRKRDHLLVTLYWVGLGVKSLSLLEESNKDLLGYRRYKRELLVRDDDSSRKSCVR
jgi:hypothetical protein